MTTAQIATLIISICSLLGVGTAMTLFWNDMHSKKKQKIANQSEEHQMAMKMERKAELEEMAKPIVDGFSGRLDILEKKLDAISSGTLSTLRNDILSCYYKCRDKGYRNDYDYTNIHDLFESYIELNGNSFVKDVIERFDSLPTKEEFKEKEVSSLAAKAKSTKKKKVLNEDKQA